MLFSTHPGIEGHHSPKQLAAILGMAALLIRAPTEFEMVGIHLFEPLAARDVPQPLRMPCRSCWAETCCGRADLDAVSYSDAPMVN